MIPYGRQSISSEDVDAVVRVLTSDFLTQGPVVPEFEQAVAARAGAARAVAVNSATSALHIACLALGVGPDDRVWTVPNTFVASANCARYCGAGVDFVDIDPETYNMSVPALEAKLAEAERHDTLPKVVIPVHFSGQPADLDEIAALSRRYRFRIIEDASHAVGATYHNSTIGDCSHSDIVIFSFHPVKIITSGEGGMALTNDEVLADRMALLRSHGITRDASLFAFDSPGPWYYEQIELGFNYRMIELEAALGLSQLARLDHFVDRRNEIAAVYDQQLAGLPIVRPAVRPDRRSSFHLYVVRLPKPDRIRHRAVFEAMRAAGIGVNLHYIPVHLQPDFRPLGFAPGMFPVAEAYADAAVSLPIFPDLREEDQRFVTETLSGALEGVVQ